MTVARGRDGQPAAIFSLASAAADASLLANVNPAKWWLYMIRTTRGALYTGITTDVIRRFREHASGRTRGSRFLRGNPPATIVLRQRIGSRILAARIEYQIKKLNKARKEAIVATGRIDYNARSGGLRFMAKRPKPRRGSRG